MKLLLPCYKSRKNTSSSTTMVNQYSVQSLDPYFFDDWSS